MGELSLTSSTQTTPNSNKISVLNPFCSSLILKPARHWAYLNSTQLSSRPVGPWRGTAKVWLIFSLPGRSWRHWSETSRLLPSAPLTWTKTCWNNSTNGPMWVFNISERLPQQKKTEFLLFNNSRVKRRAKKKESAGTETAMEYVYVWEKVGQPFCQRLQWVEIVFLERFQTHQQCFCVDLRVWRPLSDMLIVHVC